MMLKKLLYNLYLNYTYKKIISKDIINGSSKKNNTSSIYLNESNYLKRNGIIQLDGIDNQNIYLDSLNTLCDLKIKNFDFKGSPIASFSYIHSNDGLAKKVLTDKKINFIIKDYLGEDAKLDFISLSATKNNSFESIISEKWHYDNVGKRLKLFYYLNNNENISTDYVLKSNNILHKNYSTEGSRRSEIFISKYKNEIKSFFPQKGKILIFDTNGFHKGNYKRQRNTLLKDENLSNDYRKMLKFEFSSSIKSDLFFGKSNTIGVRGTFFRSDYDFLNCPLIDHRSMNDLGEFYFYDKAYKILNNN